MIGHTQTMTEPIVLNGRSGMGTNLDGKLVRIVYDISVDYDENCNEIIVKAGTEFIWDDSTTDQNIDGALVFVEPDEVEIVE